MKAERVEDLVVYQEAFELQQRLFARSKSWPREEAYSLTDQARRASRSIGANLAEAWAKRPYPAHFLSKLTDADGELNETRHWIQTAKACAYIEDDEARALHSLADTIGGRIGTMILKHEQFCHPRVV